MTALAIIALPALSADEDIEPLDSVFLDYLANMEGEDDDWTLLADSHDKDAAPVKGPIAPAKTSKEAAGPAGDEG